MRNHAFVRRVIPNADADQQRAVKPPAILIRAFQINVGGPFRTFQYRKMRRAGIEPHIENVVFLPPFRSAAGAFGSRGQQLFRRVLVPGVRTLFLKPLHDVAQRRKILQARALQASQ